MTHNHTQGVSSTAAIAGHPIHPILVPFPIAFFIGVLATDLGYWWTADPFWARASLWLAGAALATGLLAAIFGLVDFLTIGRAREHSAGWIHLFGNAIALILALANLGVRWSDPVAATLPWGLSLSAIVGAILIVTGWLGGELVYRHMIGVTGHGGEEMALQEQKSSEKQHHHAAVS
ncbi:MAG: DUF2231 domain-containing protein [Anaerolineae bacterium]|nr:DUF2231 domain-containing protein [Anaerolineae bacterium]